MSNSPQVQQLLADSRLAFLNQQNDIALKLANQAIKLEANNADAYKCAANAYLFLKRYDEAVDHYSLAVKFDSGNGNRYYDLGFALVTNKRPADGLESLAKADELGCAPENLVKLYNLLGILCYDMKRYDDSLTNLKKVEQLVGIKLDILERKAIIYGIKGDTKKGLQTANQIKLVAPSGYRGYRIAFNLLLEVNRLDAATKELEMAGKHVAPSMEFYFDQVTLELKKYQLDKDKIHFDKALEVINKALTKVKPEVKTVIENYINAAEIYLQLENPDKTIDCLNAAQAPIDAYNNGFAIIDKEIVAPAPLTDADISDMLYEDQRRLEETFGEYGLQEVAAQIASGEIDISEYFTEVDEEIKEEPVSYKLDRSEPVNITPENRDQINRLYVGAFTLRKDFKRVIDYARMLQSSKDIYNSYMGRYTEVKAMKELGTEDTRIKYEELIKFFRNTIIKDPTDIMAVTFRIQCYIDIEKYDEAKEACSLLTVDAREPFLKKIADAKQGGE